MATTIGLGLGSPLAAGFANQQALWKSLQTPQGKAYSTSAPAAKSTPAPAAATSAPASSGVAQTAVTAYVDPAIAARAKAQADFNSAKNTTFGSITDAINDTGRKFNSSILDYVDTLRSGQRAIDRAAVQNEMARESGRLGVIDSVGSGIRNAGTMLSAKGATSSSAAEEIAKLYSKFGQKQLSSVGNQYELGLQDIADQQTDLGEQTSQFQRHYGEQKETAINSIVQDASNKLAALNAAAQNASLAERIDIEQQKAAIRNQALSTLASYDTALTQGISSVTAATKDTNRAQAKAAILAGTAPETSFDYTTQIPGEFQGTGPYSSPLQVFAPGRKDDRLQIGV